MNARKILTPFADVVRDEPVLVTTGSAALVAWLVSQFGISADLTNLIRVVIIGLLAVVARWSVTPTSRAPAEVATVGVIDDILKSLEAEKYHAATYSSTTATPSPSEFHSADLGKTDSAGFSTTVSPAPSDSPSRWMCAPPGTPVTASETPSA